MPDFVMRRAVHFGGTEAGFGVDLNRSARPRVTAVDPVTQVVSFALNPVMPSCTADAIILYRNSPAHLAGFLGYWSGISTRYTGLFGEAR